jgi:hypothetical protein
MNIKITKEEYNYVLDNALVLSRQVVGSRMYGTNTEKSDTDILIVYKNFMESDNYYPNYHQLQYDDIENNTQYILTTETQFFRNLYSGDSTINFDVVLYYTAHRTKDDKLNMLRTFNIIKAFIGFAKRDIKQVNIGKNKLFHIERSLYCAEELLHDRLPNTELFIGFGKNDDITYFKNKEIELRKMCNALFEVGDLTMYPKLPIFEPVNDLERKIIEANNIKEFKY